MSIFFSNGSLLAVYVSTGPIFVLAHGFFGAGSTFTATILVANTIFILLAGSWTFRKPNICDVLYYLLLVCIAVSFIENDNTSNPKEIGLLLITLAAFPAGIVTCTKLTYRSTVLTCCLTALPVAIFAASVVRFALIAMVASLILVCLMERLREQKLRIAALIVTIMLSITVGLFARASTTLTFLQYATSVVTGVEPISQQYTVSSGCPGTDMRNSIAIREQLYVDAFRLLPDAGLFGKGLDSFMSSSCVRGHEVHNTPLQVAIEFGWLAALDLVALVAVGLMSLARMPPCDLESRFVLCSLFFVACLSIVYGQVSRDALLFLFLGYASGIRRLLVNLGVGSTRTHHARDKSQGAYGSSP
jgi:O-Antigen ligase